MQPVPGGANTRIRQRQPVSHDDDDGLSQQSFRTAAHNGLAGQPVVKIHDAERALRPCLAARHVKLGEQCLGAFGGCARARVTGTPTRLRTLGA